ncbi:phosphatase PAP2 family protein [Streptomyces sp. GZWMJZ-114]|uniref:phosphatase PAP2 family protein n=1 Tax=Streptomyces sp. GZWMJZ-114 TaxID=2494734 RepID=UPI001012B1B8|nr:phosphatase PAP2 family protein [Streptomyces sp. GZWMJZ-114]
MQQTEAQAPRGPGPVRRKPEGAPAPTDPAIPAVPADPAAPPGSRTPAEPPPSAPARPVRLRWWSEICLLALLYGVYSAGRLFARGDVRDAIGHGLAILRLEKFLHINLEHPLNRLFTREPWLGIPADFWYASLHYLVTPLVLIWLFRARHTVYRAARTWLMTSTLIGLIGFTFLPTCPPRLLAARHGFVDTMAQFSDWGWWGGEASAPRGLGGMTNQYAAMPSLHVGWALWCGFLLWRHARTRWMRAAGIAYPTITALVVMGTANHYLLDALAGAAVMGAGALLTRPVLRGAARVREWLRPRLPRRLRPALLAGGTAYTVAVGGGASGEGVGGEGVVSGGCETSPGERIPQQRPPRQLAAERPGGAPAAAR